MKGLLKKDFLVLFRAYKLYMIVAVLLVVQTFLSGWGWQVIFPALICGMLPVSLYSLDERDKWNTYALTTTYTRRGLLSEKYLLGVIIMLVITAVSALAMSVYALRVSADIQVDAALCTYDVFGHNVVIPYAAARAIESLLHSVSMALIPTAVSLPFMFLFGAEKGRLIAPVVLGFSATLLVSFELSRIGGAEGFVDLGAALGLAGIAAALYAVSWLVSVLIVQKRDF